MASQPEGVYGGVRALVDSARASGVSPLKSGSRPTDLELFMMDASKYAVGLARVFSDGTLEPDILEGKMKGYPFYINTYLTFTTQTP